MDENPKKGARDLSDLKARLGLKKGEPGAAPGAPIVTPTGTPAVPGPQPVPTAVQVQPSVPTPVQTAVPAPVQEAVVPMQQVVPAPIPAPMAMEPSMFPAPPGYVPPPPGYEPEPEPEGEPEPPPDPRRDPFAAAQAQAGGQPIVYYMPVPGTDDGAPVAQVSKRPLWRRIGLVAGVGIVLFGVGHACGQGHEVRVQHNRTIDDATTIKGEVDKLAKNLEQINTSLKESLQTNKLDVELAIKLGQLDLKEPDSAKLFHTNYVGFPDVVIDRLFNYYNDTKVLYGLIKDHASRSAADREAITKGLKAAGKGSEKLYGVTLVQAGPLTQAQFVELGAPTCDSGTPPNCQPTGFTYRQKAGEAWAQRPLKGKPTEIVVPIVPGELLRSVAAGDPDVLQARDFGTRTANIIKLADKLGKDQQELLAGLKRAAETSRIADFY